MPINPKPTLLQCARGNLYFCSSEPEPTESKGRLVIGTRLKASRGQGGSLNYLTVAPREEITLLTHPPCQQPTGNLWSLTAVRDLMGTSKVRGLCLGFGCWYPYYVPFVDSALETVGRGPECQTDLEQWDATFGARRDDSRVTSVSTEQNRTSEFKTNKSGSTTLNARLPGATCKPPT